MGYYFESDFFDVVERKVGKKLKNDEKRRKLRELVERDLGEKDRKRKNLDIDKYYGDKYRCFRDVEKDIYGCRDLNRCLDDIKVYRYFKESVVDEQRYYYSYRYLRDYKMDRCYSEIRRYLRDNMIVRYFRDERNQISF